MKSPYEILGIAQDANNIEITRAVPLAMRKREYDARQIADARAQLSRPESRLAADFLFPVFATFANIKSIVPQKKSSNISLDDIDENKYNTLNV